MNPFRQVIAVTMLLLAATAGTAVAIRPSRRQQPLVRGVAQTRAKAVANGVANVIVGLRVPFTPEGLLSPAAIAEQRARIAAARARVLELVDVAGRTHTRAYPTLPYVALRLPADAVERLRHADVAASVSTNRVAQPADPSGAAAVEASESASTGGTGAGQTIAILDSGIDKTHPFLQQRAGGPSKVVSEACYSGNGNCPGGVKASTGAGSGIPCTYAPGCNHGTFVAGIAAGRAASADVDHSGVARDANLISIQIESRFTGNDCTPPATACAGILESDILAGLERVYALRNSFHIAAVNLSVGRYGSSGNCDADPLKAAIDNLRAAGIATVIASGNDGNTTGVSIPSCISTAITVGSSTLQLNTTRPEKVSTFSNSSPQVDLLAPGEYVLSSIPGVGFATDSGTSFAAPQVAGAFAILRQLSPASAVTTLLYHLQHTGKPITDMSNNVTVPRIRVSAASLSTADTASTAGDGPFAPGWDMSRTIWALPPPPALPRAGRSRSPATQRDRDPARSTCTG